MLMTWHELLWAHWEVAAEALRRLLPAGLELDLFEGRAWLGVIPFRMTGIHARFLPPLPGLSAFPELNVRTYVVRDGVPGVWFFSLDAANRWAVASARRSFHLNYLDATMTSRRSDAWIRYSSLRTDARGGPARWTGEYRGMGEAAVAAPGTLDHFLCERYCLYSCRGDGRIRRGGIHHEPWRLQAAEARIEVNTMACPLGVELLGEPRLAYAERIEVAAWLPRAC